MREEAYAVTIARCRAIIIGVLGCRKTFIGVIGALIVLLPEVISASTRLSSPVKLGFSQLVQTCIFADYSRIERGFLAERGEASRDHVGSVAIKLHSVGPNLLRPTPETVALDLNDLQKTQATPLLVGADVERGAISRMSESPDMPNMMAFGATGDPALARRLGEIAAREARAVGIDWAFAPVSDVNIDPRNPIIGDRSFGDDPQEVAKMVAAYIEGAHAGGLLVTAKHFPGQGDTGDDSHVGMVTLNQNMEQIKRLELPPFEAAIKAGVDAIMLAQVRVPALDPDPDRIATTSPKIIHFLRHNLGFKGVIISDAMEMRGITDLWNSSLPPSL